MQGFRLNQLFFFHNPKAAGSSLAEVIAGPYPPSRVCPLIENDAVGHAQNKGDYSKFRGYDLYAGHYGADIFRAVCEAHMPITSFRHPADRLFSLFRFYRDLNIPTSELTAPGNEAVAVARTRSFEDFAMSNDPVLRLHNENHHFRQLSNSGWDLKVTQSVADVLAFIESMPWFAVVEEMALSMRWANEVFGWDQSSAPITNARPHATRSEINELESLRNEIVKRNSLDYEIFLHAVDIIRSRRGAVEVAQSPSRGTPSYPSIEGLTYKLELRTSPTLWVVLCDKTIPEEWFNVHRLSENLPGSVIEARVLRDEFDQHLIDRFAPIVTRIADDWQVDRIFYLGFSAGADAALSMAHRDVRARRILAFSPRMDMPLRISEPQAPTTVESLDKSQYDLVKEINASTVRSDIFIGVHAFYAGRVVRRSLEINNPLVTCHYVRSGEAVDFELNRDGLLGGVLSTTYADGQVDLPEAICASREEAETSLRIDDLVRALEKNEEIELPDEDDRDIRNPQWWNVKSRVRAAHGDYFGAIGDIVHAIALDGRVAP